MRLRSTQDEIESVDSIITDSIITELNEDFSPTVMRTDTSNSEEKEDDEDEDRRSSLMESEFDKDELLDQIEERDTIIDQQLDQIRVLKKDLKKQVESMMTTVNELKQDLEKGKTEKENKDERIKELIMENNKLTALNIMGKTSDADKEKISTLESSLAEREKMFNTVLEKLGSSEKDLKACKVNLNIKEEEIALLKDKIDSLEKEAVVNKKEMASHVEIVSKIIENNEFDQTKGKITNGISKESSVTKTVVAESDEKIKDLKQSIKKKDSEIRNWKSRFSALEGTLADVNLQVSSLKENVLVSNNELKREKEINDCLLDKIRMLNLEPKITQMDTPLNSNL